MLRIGPKKPSSPLHRETQKVQKHVHRTRHLERRATVVTELLRQHAAVEREVQKALRKTLLKYHLHKDQDLFDRAYGYIRQYF